MLGACTLLTPARPVSGNRDLLCSFPWWAARGDNRGAVLRAGRTGQPILVHSLDRLNLTEVDAVIVFDPVIGVDSIVEKTLGIIVFKIDFLTLYVELRFVKSRCFYGG